MESYYIEPQIDFTLSGAYYLTPLIAYRRISPIVAVSRAGYSFRGFNETNKSKLSMGLLIGYPSLATILCTALALSKNNITAVLLILLARFMLTGAFGYQAKDNRVLDRIAHSYWSPRRQLLRIIALLQQKK